MTQSLTQPLTAEDLLASSEMSHIVCCDDDTAICGIDVSDAVWRPDEEDADCVVCIELEELPCPNCDA